MILSTSYVKGNEEGDVCFSLEMIKFRWCNFTKRAKEVAEEANLELIIKHEEPLWGIFKTFSCQVTGRSHNVIKFVRHFCGLV